MKISIYVRKDQVKPDGTYGVYLRFKPARENRFLIYTEIDCYHEPVNMIFPPSEPSAQHKSFRLMQLYTACQDYIYHNQDKPLAIIKADLSAIVTGRPAKKKSLADLFGEYANEKKDSYRKMYERTLRKVLEYDKKADFNVINVKWLERFATWLAKGGAKTNGIAFHMRNLRAVFNYALDEEITTNYPFRRYRIKQEQTRKRDLTIEQLRTLRDYDCHPLHQEYRDIFMLSFYLCGINIGDLLLLKKENVVNGRIEYYRQKTNKYYSIKIEPEAQEILERYKGNDWLLSMMDHLSDYHTFSQHQNRQLKKIGMTYNEGQPWSGDPLFPGISTYWARHTWASMAAEADVPMDVIAQALGHATPYSTTDIYVNRRLKKIDEANRKVLDLLIQQ